MVTPCSMQSGVAVRALEPEPALPNASPGNHHVRFKISMFLGLALRVLPSVTRLTVYCWLHIPTQGDRDPDQSIILWNKWMVSVEFLWIWLSQ